MQEAFNAHEVTEEMRMMNENSYRWRKGNNFSIRWWDNSAKIYHYIVIKVVPARKKKYKNTMKIN